MAFTKLRSSRRLSLTLPTKPSNQDIQANHEHEHTNNAFELIDLAPATFPHHPQPPSPLLTFAPDSPPYFPFARSLSDSSFSELDCTVKPLPPPLLPFPSSSPSTPNAMAKAHNTTATSLNGKSAPMTATALTTASSAHPSSSLYVIKEDVGFDRFVNSRSTYKGSIKFDPFYEADEENKFDDAENDMPPGFPYEDWRGIGLLALEYLKGMQGLLLGFMEQDCRWGGARHTI
ncbi:MAG: hypothetical protein LQ343_000408 [Gyalolechia ehrenbergii]|nr:MAG: hypothetical protein LQ343_000408 [Gyalolechia ehrenbergii]